MKKSTFLILFIFVSSLSYSNNLVPELKIEGRIVEYETGIPLAYVTVALYNSVDSSLVNGTVSDEEGFFEFNNLNYGSYYTECSFMGFEKYISAAFLISKEIKKHSLGEIIMKPATYLLEEVTVKTKTSPLSSTVNKQVINAASNLNAAGGNAVDLLRSAASIEVGPENEVKLRGSTNFTVLIDGRPSLQDAASVLQQTPAGQVSKIEIITNPPVKYSAEGGAGIINIIMKKGAANSSNGMVNASVGSGNKYSSDLQFNRNKEKFSLSLGLDGADHSNQAINAYDRKVLTPDTSYYGSMLQDRHYRRKMIGLRLGLNYDPALDHNFHYSLHSGINDSRLDITAPTSGFTDPVSVSKYFANEFSLHQTPRFITNSLGYSGNLGSGDIKFNSDVYYSFIDYYFKTSQETAVANSGFEKIDERPVLTDVINDNYSNDLRWDADISFPIGKAFQLQSGFSWHHYLRSLDVSYSLYDHEEQVWVDHPFFTNKFDFNESVMGVFADMNGDIKGMQLSIGLRGEYTNRELMQKTEGISYDFGKMNWFPAFSLSGSVGNDHHWGIAFSNRINRPNEYILNPFPEFEDEYFYSEGNPNLIPEIVRNLEANYRWVREKVTLSTNLYLRVTEDKIEQLMVEDTQTGKLHLSFHNDASDRNIGLEAMGNLNLKTWWSMSISTSVYHHLIYGKVAGEELRKDRVGGSAQMVNSFHYANSTLQLTNYYQSRTQALQYDVTAFHFMDIALNQKLLDGKLTLGFRISDILKSRNFNLITVAQNTYLDGKFTNESPVFMLNASYQLNQYKKKTKDVQTEFDM